MRPQSFAVLAVWLVCLCAHVSALAASDGWTDAEVVGSDVLKTDPKALRLLRQNGFVVAGTTRPQMHQLYRSRKVPPLVTTDALLHAYSVVLRDSLKVLEQGQSQALASLLDDLWGYCRYGVSIQDDRQKEHALGLLAVVTCRHFMCQPL